MEWCSLTAIVWFGMVVWSLGSDNHTHDHRRTCRLWALSVNHTHDHRRTCHPLDLSTIPATTVARVVLGDLSTIPTTTVARVVLGLCQPYPRPPSHVSSLGSVNHTHDHRRTCRPLGSVNHTHDHRRTCHPLGSVNHTHDHRRTCRPLGSANHTRTRITCTRLNRNDGETLTTSNEEYGYDAVFGLQADGYRSHAMIVDATFVFKARDKT
jgi:hypothetical protein